MVCVCVCVRPQHMSRVSGGSWELVLSLHYELKNQTQVVKVWWQVLWPAKPSCWLIVLFLNLFANTQLYLPQFVKVHRQLRFDFVLRELCQAMWQPFCTYATGKCLKVCDPEPWRGRGGCGAQCPGAVKPTCHFWPAALRSAVPGV